MQINPNQKIQLAALISDTTDSTQYYVQCVMRDTATNTILGTVNLTNDPAHIRRFYGSMSAPSQGNGGGRFIDITTTIYTDAGHTTPAASYGETIEKYLVQYIWNPSIGGAGSGDPFANSERSDSTRKVIRDEFAVLIEEIGKIGGETRIVEGKAKGVNQAEITRKLTETVEKALAAKGKPNGDIKALKRDMRDAIESIKEMPELVEISKQLDSFTELPKQITELTKRLEYIWEHVYLREMTGDGLPLPSETSKMPRTASDGVMPLEDVMKRHAERRAGFFDAAPPAEDPGTLPALPSIGGGRMPSQGVIPTHLRVGEGDLPDQGRPQPAPILSDFTIRPSKRKPSAHVVPSHVLEGNARALELMPQ
jgi:hypothetical protein